MRGSYLAKIVDGEIQREKRRQEMIFKRKCKRCKNKETDLCHTVRNIEGELQCVNYEVE